MPGAPETFKTVINQMTHGTNSKRVNLLHAENANLTHKDLNTSIDALENWWNDHLVSYDTLTSRARPSKNGQLSYSACSFEILISRISRRLKTVWAGKLRWMQKLDSNFKSLLLWDSIHSMTGVIRWCGWFQVCLKIHRMILWWKSMVLSHSIPLQRVRCMLSGLTMTMLNRMQRSELYRLQSLARYGGGQNLHCPMENHSFGHRMIMHTSLISSWQRMSKQN